MKELTNPDLKCGAKVGNLTVVCPSPENFKKECLASRDRICNTGNEAHDKYCSKVATSICTGESEGAITEIDGSNRTVFDSKNTRIVTNNPSAFNAGSLNAPSNLYSVPSAYVPNPSSNVSPSVFQVGPLSTPSISGSDGLPSNFSTGPAANVKSWEMPYQSSHLTFNSSPTLSSGIDSYNTSHLSFAPTPTLSSGIGSYNTSHLTF
jgi:hypothetical protein